MITKPWAIGIVFLCTFITAFAQITLKLGVKSSLPLISNYYIIGGLFLYLAGAGLLLFALRYGELSVLYPIFATSYIWVSLLSPRFFETDFMNIYKWAGIFIIISGVYLIGKGAKNG